MAAPSATSALPTSPPRAAPAGSSADRAKTMIPRTTAMMARVTTPSESAVRKTVRSRRVMAEPPGEKDFNQLNFNNNHIFIISFKKLKNIEY